MTHRLCLQDAPAPNECWTHREILQQPETLSTTHTIVSDQRDVIADFLRPILERAEARIVLTGAGTSAFIGDSIAAPLTRLLDRPVEAIATTDIVSAPDLHLRPSQPLLLVSFGRSGNSPESIAAIALADARVTNVRHLIITCNAAGALARRRGDDTLVILLPEATDDRGLAMTSSFSAMLLAALIALGGPVVTAERVSAIAAAVRDALASEAALARLASRRFTRAVYLGSGAFKGLAREAALKLLELSDGQMVSVFDTSLGFRHGPKAIIDNGTIVVVFLSNDPLTRRYDLDIVQEIRTEGHCGELITISAQPDDMADIFIPGMHMANDVDLLFPFLVPAQLFALHVSLTLGLTPDTPNASGAINRIVQGVHIHSFA